MFKLFNMESSIHTDIYVIKEGIKFISEHSFAQTLNALKYFLFKDQNNTCLSWDPVYVTILIDSVCNQRCLYCMWHSPFTNRPYWHNKISLKDYKRIIDVLKERKIAHAHICGTGDPLMNKSVFQMIDYTIKNKITCSIMTNMNKHVSPHLEKLACSGINRLNTNLDSGDPEQFEKIRIGAKWDIITENIKKLSEFRQTHKKKFRIGIYCIAMRSNAHTYKNLMKTAKEIGADDIIFSYLIPVDFVKDPICSKENVIQKTDREMIAQIDDAVKYGRKIGLRVYPPRFPPKSKTRVNCSTMWWKLMINLPNDKIPKNKWVGNVSSHCHIAHESEYFTYGNILSQSFDNVWNGEKIQNLRKKLIEDAPNLCKECPGL